MPRSFKLSTWVVSLWDSVYENFLDKNLTYGICGIQCYHLIFSKFMVVASKQSNIDIDQIVYNQNSKCKNKVNSLWKWLQSRTKSYDIKSFYSRSQKIESCLLSCISKKGTEPAAFLHNRQKKTPAACLFWAVRFSEQKKAESRRHFRSPDPV